MWFIGTHNVLVFYICILRALKYLLDLFGVYTGFINVLALPNHVFTTVLSDTPLYKSVVCARRDRQALKILVLQLTDGARAPGVPSLSDGGSGGGP